MSDPTATSKLPPTDASMSSDHKGTSSFIPYNVGSACMEILSVHTIRFHESQSSQAYHYNIIYMIIL